MRSKLQLQVLKSPRSGGSAHVLKCHGFGESGPGVPALMETEVEMPYFLTSPKEGQQQI